IVVEIVVEIPFRIHPVAGIVLWAPKIPFLLTAGTSQPGGDTARNMRHMDGESRMGVEYTGIDEQACRYDRREFATDRAPGVEAIELMRIVEIERGVHEDEQAELLRLGPERLVFGVVEKKPIGLRRNHHALKAELVLAAGELFHGLGPAMRMRVRSAD